MSSHYSAAACPPPPPSRRCLLQAPSIRPIDPVSPWCGTCLFRGLSEKDGSAGVMYLGFFSAAATVPEGRYKVNCCLGSGEEMLPRTSTLSGSGEESLTMCFFSPLLGH